MFGGDRATVVSVVFPVIAAASVAARLYTRCRILRNPGWDEGIILVSLIFSIASSALTILEIKYGLGRHFSTLTPDHFSLVLKYLWASIICYNFSAVLTKISLVLQYNRIFSSKRMRLALWSSFVFICCHGIWALVSGIFRCMPIAYFWDRSLHGQCFDKKFLFPFNGSLNLITEIVLITLPMPILKSLQLPRMQMISLMCIFGLGAFICLFSILRFKVLYKISISTDPTYGNVDIAIWSIMEINVGILCSSLATLRLLISRPSPRLLFSSGYPAAHVTHINVATGAHPEPHIVADGTDALCHSHFRTLSHSSRRSSGHSQLEIPQSHVTATRNMALRRGKIVTETESDVEQGRNLDHLGEDILITTAAGRSRL